MSVGKEAMSPEDFSKWAARQSLEYDLVDGRPVRKPDEQQALFRLGTLGEIAQAVFGEPNEAADWLATPNAELCGLCPTDVAAESEEGRQLVLRTLVRRRAAGSHRDHA